ncbi:MAG: pyridoxamine 5'-phosphate oxidase [Ferruginibacter sp.]
MNDIASIRKDYTLQTFDEKDVAAGPMQQFATWFKAATESEISEVNAMTLATANSTGRPSARIVLLKGFDENGFVFFTNYNSRKAQALAENPHASLVFFWKELERQVRIEGSVKKTSVAQNENYFNSRPVGSKIGAWASEQSSIIESRRVIENKAAELAKEFSGDNIECPPFWGGYLVVPELMEFWQGRTNRLHDRIQYRLTNNYWKIERLSP